MSSRINPKDKQRQEVARKKASSDFFELLKEEAPQIVEDHPKDEQQPSQEQYEAVNSKVSRRKVYDKRQDQIKGNRQHKLEEIKHKSDKVSLFKLMYELIVNKFTNGNLDRPMSNFEVTYNHIMSEQHNKVVYQIIEYGSQVDTGYLTLIKDKLLSAYPNAQETNTDIFILHHFTGKSINLNTPKIQDIRKVIKNRMNSHTEEIAQIQAALDNNSEVTSILRVQLNKRKEECTKILKRCVRKDMSFDAVEQHMAAGGAYITDYVFIEVVSADMDILEQLCSSLENAFTFYNMVYKNICIDLDKYLKEFGLASLRRSRKGGLDVIPMQVTSTVTASDIMYNSGIIRGAVPDINFGVNLLNNYTVDGSLAECPDAQNILVNADTRFGKTQYCANIINFARCNPKYRIILRDTKGSELDGMVNLARDCEIIYFNSPDHPVCVNTYVFPSEDFVIYNNRQSLYDLLHSITSSCLYELISPTEDIANDVHNICDGIVTSVFVGAGVIRDLTSTYGNSKNIKYRDDTWVAIKALSQEIGTGNSMYTDDALKATYLGLLEFFGPGGKRSERYNNEIYIEDILDTNLLDFDMGKLTGGAPLTRNEYAMLELQCSLLSDLYTFRNNDLGYTTIEVTEELNILLSDDVLAERLAQVLLSHACKNKVNFLVCNSNEFLVSKNCSKAVNDVRQALNGVIMGTNKSPDNVIKHFHLENVADLVRLASENDGTFKYAFFIDIPAKDKRLKALVKLPYSQEVLQQLVPGKDINLDGQEYFQR